MKLTFDVPDDIALGIKAVVEETIVELTKWPQKNDQYWFLCADGLFANSKWCDDLIDKNRLVIGNCFKTEEEAEFKFEQLKVLHELEELADDDQPWDQPWGNFSEYNHYYLLYNAVNSQVGIGVSCMVNMTPFYFNTFESAEAAISKIGEERLKKYYFCIPEDKT